MKINTYGIKMKGLRKACGETKGLSGYYSGEYIELFYDRNTGEVWTVYQYSLGQNTWTVYHDKNIIHIANISKPKTMQELANLIKTKAEEQAAIDAWYEQDIEEQKAWEEKIEHKYGKKVSA